MLPTHFQPVLRLPRNTRGRDFVVGDLHGAFDLLEGALRQANFDESRDRLLMVGDLEDRGRASARCIELLLKDWAVSARGNHEQMALESFDSRGELKIPADRLQAFHRNGMGWWLKLSAPKRLELLKLIERLPFALETETSRGTVGIIHADVPVGMDWPTFIGKLEALDNRTLQVCIWGRARIEADVHAGVPGVGRVFVGHTPQWGGLRRYGNVYAVDTGAVFGQEGNAADGSLSLFNVVTKSAVTLAKPKARLINVLDEPELSRPFSTGPGYIQSLYRAPFYGLNAT